MMTMWYFHVFPILFADRLFEIFYAGESYKRCAGVRASSCCPFLSEGYGNYPDYLAERRVQIDVFALVVQKMDGIHSVVFR